MGRGKRGNLSDEFVGNKTNAKPSGSHDVSKVNKPLSKAMKRLISDKASNNVQSPKLKRATVASKTEKTVAKFVEDGDEVLLEVEGQATDFGNEFDSEYKAEVEEDTFSVNNNASMLEPRNSQGMDEVRTKPIGKEAARKSEEVEMQKFIDFMRKQGLVIVDTSKQGNNEQRPHNQGKGQDDQVSEVTIYRNAVQPENSKRDSSSSDDISPMDTSDENEFYPIPTNRTCRPHANNVDNFVVENIEQMRQRTPARMMETSQYMQQAALTQQPHCSYAAEEPRPQQHFDGQQPTRHQEQLLMNPLQLSKAEQIIRDAEASRAKIMDVKGKNQTIFHSALLDEDYLIVGNYVDDLTKRKIGNGEYIDFAKLMPKDRVSLEEDTHMEMVNKGGLSFWVPVAERENTAISSFRKWEQAFRVFSNIYGSFHPSWAGELMQYNHIIHTAS